MRTMRHPFTPRRAAALAVLAGAGFACSAACLSDAQARDFMARFERGEPAANPVGLDDADGDCSRAKVHALLLARYGKVVGYKAGLTNPALQKRFNYFKPVWGRLYEGMVLADGATVPAAFGARPLFEADMLMRVGSADVNRATTALQALEAIDQIIPFIELPDLMVEAPPQLTGPAISAINVGARLGVAGQPVPVPRTRAERYAMLDALRDMRIVLSDGSGELARGKGSDIAEHPLNAVLFLVAALKEAGLALQPGDVLSLGSFSALFTPRPGQTVRLQYEGLPGAAPVSVTFK